MTDAPAPRPAEAVAWLAFTADHDRRAAAERFAARWGQAPERCELAGGILLVGPVPEGAER